MKIAVDAMGGDYAPHEIVAGAVEAACTIEGLETVFLVGDEQAIRAELSKQKHVPDCIQIHHASEVVEMDEKPALAVRRKKDSSIGRAVDLVKSGEADAVVSAGNTGAAVAACQVKLRTLEGVERPAIAAVMPTVKTPFVLLDAGANIEATPEMLKQFAVMGSVYSRTILGNADPVVGVLSIGGEDIKGNDSTRGAVALIKETKLNFRGNCEGHDLFEGDVDVVVCDGFIGNVVLKTTESVATAIGHWMKEEFKKHPIRIFGALLLTGALRSMKRRLDPEVYGGAPLLGVNGVCIITHGSSSSKAIFHAVRVAAESVHAHLNETIVSELKETGTSQ
jgi:glycerol-3-phosphate acyltransferase PlsX